MGVGYIMYSQLRYLKILNHKNGMEDSKADRKSRRFRNFCFTVNNYDAADLQSIMGQTAFTYVICGEEVGDSGTPHIQGYAELEKQTRFNAVVRMLPGGTHIESRRGTGQQAMEYCKKDGTFHEAGNMRNPGKRNDIQKLRDAIDEGATLLELYATCDAMFRYPAAGKQYLRLKKKARLTPMALDLRPWQAELTTVVTGAVHPRQVLWYWDPIGNTGKTTMARYFVRNHKAFYTNGGKHADIACAYNEEKIVIFDFTRDSKERVPYSIIEAIKNGMLFSGKYNSTTKYFDIPHVVCFANFPPERDKLSADRWDIHEIVTI